MNGTSLCTVAGFHPEIAQVAPRSDRCCADFSPTLRASVRVNGPRPTTPSKDREDPGPRMARATGIERAGRSSMVRRLAVPISFVIGCGGGTTTPPSTSEPIADAANDTRASTSDSAPSSVPDSGPAGCDDRSACMPTPNQCNEGQRSCLPEASRRASCPSEGRVGGCRIEDTPCSVIAWYYAPYTRRGVEDFCAASDWVFVAP